jgi:phosphatidylserine decarboxylase
LRNYDIDESGSFSHLELFSMLDSLGSTLSKETISTFFTRFGKTTDQELTTDEVVLCLEQEVSKPREEKRRVDESTDSGSVTPALSGTPDAAATSFVAPQPADPVAAPQTDVSSNMETLKPGTEILTNAEHGTVVTVPDSVAISSRQGSLDPPSDDSIGSESTVERGGFEHAWRL